MRTRGVQIATCAVAALSGCGQQQTPRKPPTPPQIRYQRPAAQRSAQPQERCGSPALPARLITLRTGDGVRLAGAEVGTGPRTAVFLHEAPSDLCDWWPYAAVFRRAGIRALLIDLRCYGRSGCPADTARSQEPALDVGAAVARLRREGARTVTVVGASFGGANALVAGSELGRRVDGVVSLSGEAHLSAALNVPRVIGRMRAALLMAVAPGDGYISVGQARSMVRAAGSAHKRLLVRPAADGHGTQLLGPDPSSATPLLRILTRFVRSPG